MRDALLCFVMTVLTFAGLSFSFCASGTLSASNYGVGQPPRVSKTTEKKTKPQKNAKKGEKEKTEISEPGLHENAKVTKRYYASFKEATKNRVTKEFLTQTVDQDKEGDNRKKIDRNEIKEKIEPQVMYDLEGARMYVYVPPAASDTNPPGVFINIPEQNNTYDLLKLQPVMDKYNLIYAVPILPEKAELRQCTAMAMDVYATVCASHNVDKSRIYGCGKGGASAPYLPAYAPNVFAGIIMLHYWPEPDMMPKSFVHKNLRSVYFACLMASSQEKDCEQLKKRLTKWESNIRTDRIRAFEIPDLKAVPLPENLIDSTLEWMNPPAPTKKKRR